MLSLQTRWIDFGGHSTVDPVYHANDAKRASRRASKTALKAFEQVAQPYFLAEIKRHENVVPQNNVAAPDSCPDSHSDAVTTSQDDGLQISSIDNDYFPMPSAEPELLEEFDLEWDNTVLQYFFSQKQNLVLDSHHASLPHIVITPPEPIFGDYPSPEIVPQHPLYLCAPLKAIFLRSYYPSDTQDSLLLHHPTWQPSDAAPLGPKPVFSSAAFAKIIESASEERLIFYHVVSGLQRHLVKAVAIVASMTASYFRQRYDAPEFVATMDRPFQWTDPGEPLLEASKWHLDTLILDSLFPCTVPHIIINGPLLTFEDPWANAVPFMQDCAFGNKLVVVTSFTQQINCVYEEDESCSSSTYSFPVTPADENFGVEECQVVDFEEEEEIVETFDEQRPASPKYCYDDEEDELPDLNDDWYRSIIHRTQMQS
ncbi:hypothetical protein C8J56DRAFT_996912 [Mycena floridula]|nr:hypothetical protein C8J56DRAFT_996912 [Mycena floridula]